MNSYSLIQQTWHMYFVVRVIRARLNGGRVALFFFLRLDLLQNFAPGFGGLAGRVFCFQTKIGNNLHPRDKGNWNLNVFEALLESFFGEIQYMYVHACFLNKTSILERTFQKKKQHLKKDILYHMHGNQYIWKINACRILKQRSNFHVDIRQR